MWPPISTAIKNVHGGGEPRRLTPDGDVAERVTDQDLRLGPMPTPLALIPEGEYVAVSQRAEILNIYKRRTLHVEFEIHGGKYDGSCLPWYCPVPRKGGRPSRSSHFYRAWVMIHGRELRRGERPSINAFVGKMFRVRVKTVTDDHHKDPLPDGLRYSKIGKLLERLA